MVQKIEQIVNGLDEKDRKIILHARSEFAKYGFYNANMDRIAMAAGFGKGTLYRRFINKQVLFFVTIQSGQRELAQRLEQFDADLPLKQHIEAQLMLAVDYMLDNVDLLKLTMHEHSKVLEGVESSEFKDLVYSMHNFQAVFWRRVVHKAFQTAALPVDTDEEMLVSMLTAMLRAVFFDSFFMTERTGIEREQVEKRTKLFLQILFEGIFQNRP